MPHLQRGKIISFIINNTKNSFDFSILIRIYKILLGNWKNAINTKKKQTLSVEYKPELQINSYSLDINYSYSKVSLPRLLMKKLNLTTYKLVNTYLI